MAGHGQIVTDIRRPAVAVGEEKGRYEQAEDHARDDPLRGDQDEDGHDEGVLAEGEPEERVPEPLAKESDTEIDEEAGEDGPREVEEQGHAEESDARAQGGRPDAGGAARC